MTDYDIFAPFYDRVMGDRQDVIDIIQDLIKRHHPTAKTLLELGCGTGSILAGLSNQYTVSGIDQSPEMLKIAQQKLPNAQFHETTIAGFELNQTYDVILCVFDTINHLTDFSDWQKLFQSAKKHLKPGGLFIFDMNTVGRMKLLAIMPTYVQEFEGNTMEMDIERISDHEVEWHVSVQEPQPDGAIQVYEEHVRETSFPIKQIEQELASTGFSVLESFNSERLKPTNRSDRIYYACRPSA
jgi:SAM-dependent methyltransferase